MSEAKLILDMPARVYHANCGVDVPLFSSSIAKVLAEESALHAHSRHPMLGGDRHASTKAMDEGSILDALISGEADAIAVTEDFPDFRTDAAKEWRDAQIAAGRFPLVAAKFAPYANAAERIRKRLDNAGCVLTDAWQPTILFTVHASNGNPVRCKARLDHLGRETCMITDLKKVAKGANPKRPGLAHHVVQNGYDIQAQLYPMAVEQVFPHMAGRARFEWAFIEAARPNAVSRVTPSGSMRALGSARLQAAIDLWERCLRTDTWPGYEGVHRLDATSRMLEDAMVEEVSE